MVIRRVEWGDPVGARGKGKNSSPRLVLDLEKQGSKVSSLQWLRKRPKFRGIPRLVLEQAEEKGQIPPFVSSSASEKFYQRSRPRPRPRQMTPREPLHSRQMNDFITYLATHYLIACALPE